VDEWKSGRGEEGKNGGGGGGEEWNRTERDVKGGECRLAKFAINRPGGFPDVQKQADVLDRVAPHFLNRSPMKQELQYYAASTRIGCGHSNSSSRSKGFPFLLAFHGLHDWIAS
jgi:hypothetical protein